ncbi:MAG: transposase [Chitinophagaceae bacterium]
MFPASGNNIIRKKRKRHRRLAAIEPVIGHLKQDYRLCRNYLNGILGDNMNVIMVAAAMNFKPVMNLWCTEAIRPWVLIYNFLVGGCRNFIVQNLNRLFDGRLII